MALMRTLPMESFRFVAAFIRLTIDLLIPSFQGEFEKCGRVVDVYNTGKGFAFVFRRERGQRLPRKIRS